MNVKSENTLEFFNSQKFFFLTRHISEKNCAQKNVAEDFFFLILQKHLRPAFKVMRMSFLYLSDNHPSFLEKSKKLFQISEKSFNSLFHHA